MQDILALIRDYGVVTYALLFAYCVFKSGTLPIFAGYAAKAGALDIGVVFLAVVAGGYLGDEVRFTLARRHGAGRLGKSERWKRALEIGKLLIERHGAFYIFAYRYPKGLRTIGALPIGLTPMLWLRFTILNLASAFVWATLLVGAGYMLGHLFEAGAGMWWGQIGVLLLALFVLLCVYAWRVAAKDADKAGQSS